MFYTENKIPAAEKLCRRNWKLFARFPGAQGLRHGRSKWLWSGSEWQKEEKEATAQPHHIHKLPTGETGGGLQGSPLSRRLRSGDAVAKDGAARGSHTGLVPESPGQVAQDGESLGRQYDYGGVRTLWGHGAALAASARYDPQVGQGQRRGGSLATRHAPQIDRGTVGAQGRLGGERPRGLGWVEVRPLGGPFPLPLPRPQLLHRVLERGESCAQQLHHLRLHGPAHLDKRLRGAGILGGDHAHRRHDQQLGESSHRAEFPLAAATPNATTSAAAAAAASTAAGTALHGRWRWRGEWQCSAQLPSASGRRQCRWRRSSSLQQGLPPDHEHRRGSGSCSCPAATPAAATPATATAASATAATIAGDGGNNWVARSPLGSRPHGTRSRCL
ncbi:uncharacterized protein LOC128264993 isoform X5 [Drosophila gunungcola]|uniref:uncharacterized protein LOC128264993 isoform X5 n=1 Tax=Drosophila gunungcola TaxID=103775 RepID=UPI0022E1F478|nr:uncharacterized protein LOC128264993 isoform X5 [Drosophila gunungcola]